MRLALISLLIALLFLVPATAQTRPPASASSSAQNVVAQNGIPSPSAMPTDQATGSGARRDTALTRPPIIVAVIDTSGTVRRALPQLKQVARDILAAAPEASRFGVIAVNTEAQKKMFLNRADAAAYIDTLKAARKGFTDLNRATDAALTLIQGEGESRPTVVAYLTDGKLEVPDSFTDKSDFITVLRREFTSRSNIRVVVVSVNGGQLPKGAETLPPNVIFFPITNWTMAQAEVAKTLVPQIREQLTTSNAPVEPTKQTATPAEASDMRTSLIVAAGLLILLLAGGIFLSQRSRQRKRREEEAKALAEGESPENLLTEADLRAAPLERAPVQIVLLEIERAEQHGLADDLPVGRRRLKMEVGERAVVGNTAIAADLHFTELKQTQTLELRLEKDSAGVALRAYRLRPDAPGALDPVLINGQQAPKIFTLKHGDKLMVGSVVFRVVYADYRLLELLDGVGDIATDDADATISDIESSLPSPTPSTPRDEPPFTQPGLPPLFTPDEHVSLRRRYGSERSRLDL